MIFFLFKKKRRLENLKFPSLMDVTNWAITGTMQTAPTARQRRERQLETIEREIA